MPVVSALRFPCEILIREFPSAKPCLISFVAPVIHNAASILEVLAIAGTLASLAYYVLCICGAFGFLWQPAVAGEGARSTPVSILKPLRGTDPEMYESLRSHCLQDYAEYEIIFGVSDAADPAIEFVERLKTEFPALPIRLIVCAQRLGANIKVSNLAQMLPQARHDYLIVNDSDIRVEPDYLRRVVAPLADAKIGLVTCLYRGVPGPSLGSRLESLGISTDFCAGVLAARLLERGIRFGLGSTLAFRRRDLAAIGGFEALGDYLADDYELGKRIAAQGLKVRLSEVVVETFLPRYSLKGFIDHQLRWARTVRASRPAGYAGLLLTFGIPWALLALVFAFRSAWAWELLGAAVALRLAVAVVVGRMALRDHYVSALLGLIPLRDIAALFVWLAGFTGNTVTWRGDSFQLKDGKLSRINSKP
jgi:ceramide glucosyltransferase